MHPVTGELFSVGRFTLRNLILMMWKYQIFTAGMDINLLSQIFFRHHRTLNMPARTSLAPGRYPERLSLLLRLPEHKIKSILFLVLTCHQERTFTGTQVIKILVGELAVLLKLPCTVVDRTVFLISESLVN